MTRSTAVNGLIAIGCMTGCSLDNPSIDPGGDVDTGTMILTSATPCLIPTTDNGPYLLPTETPPPVSDTAAWIDFFDPENHFQNGEYIHTVKLVHTEGFECSEPSVEPRYVWKDTVFNLSEIDPKMTGTIAFDWEPLADYRDEGGDWEMMGVHAFSMEDARGKNQTFDLREFLEIEAWTFTDTGQFLLGPRLQGSAYDAKTIFFFDLNFDGYRDMQMKRYSGKGTYWANWLYNPQSQVFELSEALDAIMYPFYNCQKGLLYTIDGWGGRSQDMSTYQRDVATGQYRRVLSHSYYVHVEYLDNDEKYYWKETEWTRIEGGKTFLMRRDSVESNW